MINLSDRFIRILIIGAFAYLIYIFLSPPQLIEEQFYNWNTAGVNPSQHHESTIPLGLNYKDGAFPHYIHQSGPPHQLNLFLDPKCTGEGSCIYSKDSQNDCVLPDWKCVRDCLPKWADPPLDSDIFDFKKRHGYIPNTDGCLCRKY